jgi:hypothetical protein
VAEKRNTEHVLSYSLKAVGGCALVLLRSSSNFYPINAINFIDLKIIYNHIQSVSPVAVQQIECSSTLTEVEKLRSALVFVSS